MEKARQAKEEAEKEKDKDLTFTPKLATYNFIVHSIYSYFSCPCKGFFNKNEISKRKILGPNLFSVSFPSYYLSESHAFSFSFCD